MDAKLKPNVYYQIEALVSSPLSFLKQENGNSGSGKSAGKSDLGTLIISAIKFFLFQRSQIPVPFDRISNFSSNSAGISISAGVTSSCNDDKMDSGWKWENGSIVQTIPNPSHMDVDLSPLVREIKNLKSIFGPISSGDEAGGEECMSGRQRIRLLKQHRKQKAIQKKISLLARKQMNDERIIKICWDKIFDVLHEALGLLSFGTSNVIAVILMFGQTVLNPKETIVFQMDPQLLNNFPYTNKKCIKSDDFTTTTRRFFKSIIMSPEFPEFTAKPLPRTYTHLCILTKSPIPQSELIHNELVRLDEFNLDGVVHLNKAQQCSNKPTFHIKLKVKENSDYTDTDRQPDLCDTNSSYCYQIPCQFKGIQWRNK